MAKTTLVAEEDLLHKVDLIARQQKRSKSTVIRDALWEYVTKQESTHPSTHPLLALVGLADSNAVPTDVADGKDEEMLREAIHPVYGWSQHDDNGDS